MPLPARSDPSQSLDALGISVTREELLCVLIFLSLPTPQTTATGKSRLKGERENRLPTSACTCSPATSRLGRSAQENRCAQVRPSPSGPPTRGPLPLPPARTPISSGERAGAPPRPLAPLTILREEHQEARRVLGVRADLTLPSASGSLGALEVQLQLGAQVLGGVGAPGPLDQQRERAGRSHPGRRRPRLRCRRSSGK